MTTRPDGKIRVGIIGVLCTLALGFAAQRGPVRDLAGTVSVAGTASISGKVVTDETPARPVRRASVRIGGADLRVSHIVITDDAGDFTFSALPAGRYLITAARQGFVSTSFGAKRPEGAGSAISLSDGQRVSGMTLPLLRGGVITGVVRDQHGSPASDQSITVMRYRFNQNGQSVLSRAGLGTPQTDDRGMYRIYGLTPGEYLVVATASLGTRGNADVHQTTDAEVQWALRAARDGGRAAGDSTRPPASAPNVVYAPVFYPGTSSEAAAGRIMLRAGEERSGVDIPLLLVPAANIDGRVATADGQIPANTRISLLAHERIEGLPFSGFQASSAMPDGTFRFQGITPGTYSVAVRVNPSATPG
ncbi:MAG: carboxypeptidase-like regulatory domain-containing protein, partial [Acidobacteriota bacterium]